MTPEETLKKEDIERIFFGFALEAKKQIADKIHEPRKRVIVIAGPTASGKTDFSIQLAKKIDGEIISADSMQIYNNMDIGTAKASKEQRLECAHHLIDKRHITEPYNVVDFYFEAKQCCREVIERGNVPIITGGSGFYLHSLIYGPPSGPPSVPELRKALEDEVEKLGTEALYERLRQLDPQYASSITKHDKQKIIRALEIMTLTGKKVSKLGWKKRKKTQTYDFRCWFLYRPKQDLYERINDRCDQMLENGFLEEVEHLMEQGIQENSSASQAIGYRQAIDYLKTDKTKEDYANFVRLFKKASRNYAKRQFTWFRREPLFRWLDMDLHDSEIALDMAIQDYESY